MSPSPDGFRRPASSIEGIAEIHPAGANTGPCDSAVIVCLMPSSSSDAWYTMTARSGQSTVFSGVNRSWARLRPLRDSSIVFVVLPLQNQLAHESSPFSSASRRHLSDGLRRHKASSPPQTREK